MGIRNLHKFLKKHAPDVYKEISISEYSGKTIAVDINLYLYRFKSIHKDRWLNVFIHFILTMQKHRIRLVFVYDTKAPVEKDTRKLERKMRKRNAEKRIISIHEAVALFEEKGELDPILCEVSEKRGMHIKKLLGGVATPAMLDMDAIHQELYLLENQVINVSREDVQLSKELLQVMKIPFFDSTNEAETLCSVMCVHGQVEGVLSNDTDVLAYGTPVFLTRLNLQKEMCVEIRIDDVLEALNMDLSQFREFCIMCGTDYNRNMYRIGHDKAYKLLQKHHDIDTIEQELGYDVSILNHKRVTEIFTVPSELDETYILSDERVTMNQNEFDEFCLVNHCKIKNVL